jgi:hypothetical protein
MNFEGYRFLTRFVLVIDILALVEFCFFGVVNDIAILTIYFVLALNIFMLFMLSDFKFHKTKNSNENSQEYDLCKLVILPNNNFNNHTYSKKGVNTYEEI